MAVAKPITASRPHKGLNRRSILLSLPFAGAALAITKVAEPKQETDRDRMIRVIEQLEASQDWEASSTIAAKAFAAWQMRKALGLDMPNPKMAQAHVDYQKQKFEDYRRSIWFEQDQAAGKKYTLSNLEGVLA